MSTLRALLVALTILAMAAGPMFVLGSGLDSANGMRAYAAVTSAAPDSDRSNHNKNKNGNSNKNHNSNGNHNKNGNGNHNSNSNSNGNDNHNGNGNGNHNNNGNGNGNEDEDHRGPAPSRPAAPAPPPPPACSTPGQEMSFQTGDGRITVRVFASMTQALKFSIRQPIDPGSVPPVPGPVVGGLLFQLIAETCDGGPVPVLPAEVNLGVRYSDGDAAGLNKASFTLARLDTGANQWRPVQKQASDPGSDYASATITEMGYYVLYQRS